MHRRTDRQQASPPLLDHQHDHDDYRDENAGDLHDCQRQLALTLEPRRGAAEVCRRPIGCGRRQRDDHRENGRGEAPHDQAHDVPGMTEVAVARWPRVN